MPLMRTFLFLPSVYYVICVCPLAATTNLRCRRPNSFIEVDNSIMSLVSNRFLIARILRHPGILFIVTFLPFTLKCLNFNANSKTFFSGERMQGKLHQNRQQKPNAFLNAKLFVCKVFIFCMV